MKNKYKIHDLGQPDWVQLGVEVDAWDDDPNEKRRGVLIGYDRGSNYPYKVDFSDLTAGWRHAEPVPRWVPQPGELVVVRMANLLYLRVSVGGSDWIRSAQIGAPTDSSCAAYSIYRLPEGIPLHELPSDPKWWEKNAEKYEGGE